MESLRQAIEEHEHALPLMRAVKERKGEAVTLHNIGLVYHALGEKQKAFEYCSEALPLSRASGTRVGEAATLNNIGGMYSDLGEQ